MDNVVWGFPGCSHLLATCRGKEVCQEADCLALPTAATLCRLAELLEAEGFGEVGQVHSAVPEAGRNGVLGIGVCHLLQCRLLLVDWIGIHRASGGLPSPVVPAL